MGHGGRHFRERCTHYTLLRKEVSLQGGGGLRPPSWQASPRWLNTWAGAFAPPRALRVAVDNPAGCPPANPRLPRLRRSDLRRFPMVLQTLFPPIACRLSRLVSSSGVPPQSAEGTAGKGAAPGAGAAGPAVQGQSSPSGGLILATPSSLVVDIRSPVSDIQSPRLPIVKNIEQLPRKPRVYWTLMIIFDHEHDHC